MNPSRNEIKKREDHVKNTLEWANKEINSQISV